MNEGKYWNKSSMLQEHTNDSQRFFEIIDPYQIAPLKSLLSAPTDISPYNWWKWLVKKSLKIIHSPLHMSMENIIVNCGAIPEGTIGQWVIWAMKKVCSTGNWACDAYFEVADG
jgi:hypothetical protein